MSPYRKRESRRYFATMGVMLALVGAIWWNNNRGLSAVARETHSSLCALKKDVQVRHDVSVEYLEQHPNGLIASRGEILISRAQIQQGIDNQEATLAALEDLSC